MTIFELYAATIDEKDQALVEEDWTTVKAANALLAFIQLLNERGSLTWESDSAELTKLFRKIDENPKHIEATNLMIEAQMTKNDSATQRG